MRKVLVLLVTLLWCAPVHAHTVTVDGASTEWLTARQAEHDNGGIIATDGTKGEYVWRDAAGDTRTDFATPEDIADVLALHVTGDATHVYFLVETGAAPGTGNGALQLQIAVDMNQDGTGQTFLGNFADTSVPAANAWEYLIYTRFGSGNPPAVLDTSFMAVTATTASSAGAGGVEISVPWSAFGLTGPPTSPLRFTVTSYRSDTSDTTWDSAGNSDALDAVTDLGDPQAVGPFPNTFTEVTDGVVDYAFDVHFGLGGEVFAPLVVHHFRSNGVEFISVRNVSNATYNLDAVKVGDEETPDGGEGMQLLPPGFNLLSGDVFTLSMGTGTNFQTDFGVLPDAETSDATTAPETTDFANWATGNITLSNTGDHIIILDGANTLLDVVTYGSQSYTGVTAMSAPGSTISVSRDQPSTDTDDCSVDFAAPTNTCTASACGTCTSCTGLFCLDDSTGTMCDDGDLCTSASTCTAGVCGSGTPTDCSGLDDDCNAGVCNGTNGMCEAQPTNEAGMCNDGNLCTSGSTCSAGTCGGGTPTDCSGLDDQCNAGVCNGTTGMCEAQPANNGGMCDDGDMCTSASTCNAGTCGGGTPTDCSGLDDQCLAGVCNSTNGMCEAQPANNGGMCNDGNLCTSGSTCSAGTCGSGTPTDCSGLDDQCNAGVCNGTTGMCEAQPANNGGMCNDGNMCTTGSTCSAGTCGGGTATDCSGLDDDCNTGVCNGANGMCEAQPTNESGACDDGDLCTSASTCTAGTCGGGTVTDCSGLDDTCNIGQCNGANGMCEAQPANDMGMCDDGNSCTESDVCAAGVCAGTPSMAGTACGDACNAGVCDAMTGMCNQSPLADGTMCDDGNPCTDTDQCTTGVCGGTDAMDGTMCDDGDPCTDADACLAGMCGGGSVDCTGLDEMCRVGMCNSTTGMCEAVDLVDDTPCDDGDSCTADEVCTAGVCGGGTMVCMDMDGAEIMEDPDVMETVESMETVDTMEVMDTADAMDTADTTTDTGLDAIDMADAGSGNLNGSGCGCTVRDPQPSPAAPLALLLLVGIGLVISRRR